jgi:starch synthase
VRAVGGLRDTVEDPADDTADALGARTGFRFDHADAHGLRWALARAARTFRDDAAAWRGIVSAGMRRDSSWDASARAYRALYDAARDDRRVG